MKSAPVIIDGPVVVGGVGGSGTRLIAEILREAGFYLGKDLNTALDNLWFTVLLKRPDIFQKPSTAKTEIFSRLSVFTKLMRGDSSLTWHERAYIIHAITGMMIHGHDYRHAGRGLWTLQRGFSMIHRENNPRSVSIGWGWKEPNTHIFIEYLDEFFSTLKYIHVIRHGLDMAFSSNQAQLFNWGSVFGIERPRTMEAIPRASLEYWIRANQRICRLAATMEDRFLVINFDNLCVSPESGIRRILEFLGLRTMDDEKIHRLCLIPRKPESMGRYREHDLSCFPEHLLDEVREFGFPIEG